MEKKKVVRVVAAATLLGSLLGGCMNTAVTYGPSYRELLSKDLKAANIDGRYKIEKIECVDRGAIRDLLQGDLKGSLNRAANTSGLESTVTDALKKDAPQAFGDVANSVPVKINLTLDEKRNSGLGSVLNGFVSILTLTCWPAYMSTTYTVEVEVTFPDKVVKHDYDVTEDKLFSILPLGLIPVPAFADVRCAFGPGKPYGATLAVRAVEAAFPQKK